MAWVGRDHKAHSPIPAMGWLPPGPTVASCTSRDGADMGTLCIPALLCAPTFKTT